MYADDPTSLVDSTQKLFLFCKWHRLVNWLSTDHVSRPVIWTCSRVEQGGWLWYGSISPTGLEKSFPSNVCVDDQGPVRSNGVGSYPMKIPKSMDQESVLFWIGQRFLIHMTQEGCSGLSHLWRRLLMRKTQQGFIATLYRPPHASLLYAVGGLWIQRLGMQICANSEVGRLMISYLPQVGFIHCELMHCSKGLIDVRACFWFVVDVVSHEHWHRGGIFACLIYREQHIHTDSFGSMFK